MGPLLAMRKALYSALIRDTALLALLGGTKIYAAVPAMTEPPYISFGPAQVTAWTGGSQTGYRFQGVLEIWSLQKGDVEMLGVADRINALITSGILQPDGYHVLQCYLERVTMTPAREDGWRQTLLELVALTEQTAPPS